MEFGQASRAVERAAGSPWAFGAAMAIVLLWAVSGPLFGWSDTWQLVINTGTTIVTFLMVFLIQATQSQDTRALHAKLDELIRVIGPARNELIASEELDAEALESMREQVRREAHE
jgi:low affinity Fe/Cu permease